MAFNQGYYQQPMAGNYPMPQRAYNPNPFPAQPAQPMYPQQDMTLSGRMVTSREEALAVPVDFNAGMTFLPDMSHGRIYVKVFNQNSGGADVLEFILPNQQEKPQPAFVSVEVFDQLLQRVTGLEERFDQLPAQTRKKASVMNDAD